MRYSSVGPRSRGISAGFGGKLSPRLGGKIQKKGVKMLPPENINTFLDSKFDVDFDFAINHDLIP